MTEDEAKKKRCCGPQYCGHGRRNTDDIYDMWCVGSLCMAWRVTPKYAEKPNHGYCGLAGKP